MGREIAPNAALVLVVAAGASASLAVGLLALRKLWTGETLVPYEPRRPSPWTPLDAALVLGVFLLPMVVAYVAAPGGGRELGDLSPGEFASAILLNAALQGGVALFALALIRFRARATWADMGIVPGKLASDVALGIVAFLAVAVPTYGLQLTVHALFPQEGFHPIVELLQDHPQAWLLAVSGLAAVVAAPLTEEVLFRLLLQGCLEGVEDRRRERAPAGTMADWGIDQVTGEAAIAAVRPVVPMPSWDAADAQLNPFASPLAAPAPPVAEEAATPTLPQGAARPRGLMPIVATSLLFCALHGWPDMIPLFFFSMGLGYLYHRTHRIVPSIVMHLALNLASLTLLWIGLQSMQ
jgi:membrane protease YdiL (CAAX protease family)